MDLEISVQMIVEQIYTKCLSQGSYYIESEGEAAVIDPLREIDSYIERASKRKAKIKYVFETHFHADFVSGHISLANKTGAQIIYGPGGETSYDSYEAKDGEIFRLGNLSILTMHTPGHSMESTSFLLRDSEGKDHALFSGDTLFLGDVGRPDLANKRANMTKEELAERMYESLHNKILPLSDDIIVYPGHGAGSACGKNMMKETVDTLGNQKKINYALQPMSKEKFITALTDGLLPPPIYFPFNVMMNKEGYDDIADVIMRSMKALSPEEFESIAMEKNAVVLDVRHQSNFIAGHIPDSLFIGIDGSFAPWVGAIIGDVNKPILIVAPKGREEETVIRLARVGFDNVLGYLKGGIEDWKATGRVVSKLKSVSASELEQKIAEGAQVFDVRKPGEYKAEHIEKVPNTPLDYLDKHIGEFPVDQDFYLHCAGGYRSVIAASILKARGFHKVMDVAGGYGAIKKTGINRTEVVSCSSVPS